SGQGCNGAINISVAGGTLPYTFEWSHGPNSQNVANLCKNDYSVTVTDNKGCILVSNQITIEPAPLVIAEINETDVNCNGGDDGEACISIFGGCEPYTFSLGAGNVINSLTGDVCFDDLAAGNYTVTITDNGGLTTAQNFTIEEPDPITITVDAVINNTDPTQTNCTGAINISVTGGVPPYSYDWSHGPVSQDVSGLCHNNSPYNVVVTDANGCPVGSASIVVELGLVVDFDVMDVSCFGENDGSIVTNVSGGSPAYVFSWTGPGFTSANQNISDLSPGTYAVTITDQGGNSFVNDALVITAPSAALSITNNQITPPLVGNDGAIDITVTGGTAPYSYDWNNGATTQDIGGINGGSYTVVVTDSRGCVTTETFILPSIEPFAVEIIVDEVISCNGECDGELSAIPIGGTAPYTYLWSRGDINDAIFLVCAGNYTVTVTDANNRVGTVDFTLTEPDPIVVEFEADGARRYAKAIPIGGTAPFNYQWNNSGGTVGAELSNVPEGLYAVLVTDANGCTATGQVDLEDPVDCLEVRDIITPNRDGKNDEFIINCSNLYAENSLEVYNRWGQLVYRVDSYDNSWVGKTLDGDDLPEGTYFYVFAYKDSSGANQQTKGHVTLLRR
ncbi:MAG: gliding motility-associated C-terminal domain-containing protein, partial [Saprospiraceae bacterium]